MLKGEPSALRLPLNTKQETVRAVDEALIVLNRRMAQCDRFREVMLQTLPVDFKSFDNYMAILSTSVDLIVGRSQQPLLKGRIREARVYWESQRIAKETGRSFDEVYEMFMSLMKNYITLRSR